MTPSTRTKPIKAMLKAREVIRALMSAPDAIPARSRETAAVIVLATGVFVSPRPMPATTQPGRIHQPGCAEWLPNAIRRKPEPMRLKPAGITNPG
ncbi:hypothetical protein G6F35_016288 [Rhizopus arrhizus]|nr:hypothetical protein G6F35_016288 [Rhizopus arrhizus]